MLSSCQENAWAFAIAQVLFQGNSDHSIVLSLIDSVFQFVPITWLFDSSIQLPSFIVGPQNNCST